MPDIEHIVSPLASDQLQKEKSHQSLRSASARTAPSSRTDSTRIPHYADEWVDDGRNLPEVIQAYEGKEVVPHPGIEPEPAGNDKQIVLPYQEKEAFLRHTEEHQSRRVDRRYCGLSKKRLLLIIGVIILCCVILAVGLGIALTRGKKKHVEDPKMPSYTGIDFDDPFDEPGQAADPLADLFYQRQDGAIRQATMLMNGTWLGAAANDLVANDAKNGTPIAVTSFTTARGKNQTSFTTRHLFYIDVSGTLKERVFNNITRKWEDGTLVQLGLKPTTHPALQVCTGNDFVGNSTSSFRDGLSVFYGSNNNTIQQVGWSFGDTIWVKEQTFSDVNGRGGVACNINPWMSYVVMQNSTDIQFWWRDSNYSKRGNSSHPVGVWQKANAGISGIYPQTSLNMRAYGPRQNRNRYILTQMADLTIRGYNMTNQAENMELAPFQFQSQSLPSISIGNGVKALPGTKMAFNAADSMNMGRNTTKRTWISWLQTDPSYITQFTASSDDLNHWTESHISTSD